MRMDANDRPFSVNQPKITKAAAKQFVSRKQIIEFKVGWERNSRSEKASIHASAFRIHSGDDASHITATGYGH